MERMFARDAQVVRDGALKAIRADGILKRGNFRVFCVIEQQSGCNDGSEIRNIKTLLIRLERWANQSFFR